MCGIWQLFVPYISSHPNLLAHYRSLFDKVKVRGPDDTQFDVEEHYAIGFHRLAVNGLSARYMQPFTYSFGNVEYVLICNGEIYNHKALERKLMEMDDVFNGFDFSCDCSVLLPYFVHVCSGNVAKFYKDLDGEFAMIITEKHDMKYYVYALTDPLSVRPLYLQEMCLSQNEFKYLAFSSILKGLSDGTTHFETKRLHAGETRKYVYKPTMENYAFSLESSNYYHEYTHNMLFRIRESHSLYQEIVYYLEQAVEKRINNTDVPICCLLSGGLDSSLVAAIAAKILQKKNQRLHTFSIGMENSTDLVYARIASAHIGSIHTEILYTKEEALEIVDDVIYAIESYDITTIRASVAQYLLAQYIARNTNFKVILNGDGSDEIFMGYMYFHLAPDAETAGNESYRLMKHLYTHDGLRVDRNIANFGLEPRVPFEDKNLITFVRNMHPSLLVPHNGIEKYILRKSFEEIYKDEPILPHEVLWRRKEAFSDGISGKTESWHKTIKSYIETKYNVPEEVYYKNKFIEYFSNNATNTIPFIWKPQWTDVQDPSARELKI